MRANTLTLTALWAANASKAWAKSPVCSRKALSNIDVHVKGLQVLDVAASEFRDFTEWTLPSTLLDIAPATPIDFCNVTVTLTHPGQNDTIHVYMWLPLSADRWNGRLLAEGGGGWHAADTQALAQGVSQGYVTATTDAGHSILTGLAGALGSESWAYLSEGNINWNLLQNFASRSVGDLPKVAKQVIQGFYGKAPAYSYWQGCSTGGRQGLISAQRYPGDFDGVLSIAPAINWASFLVTEFWPQLVMRKEKHFPSQCEFAAVRQAAIDACDELDGVKDGVIAATGQCRFDAADAVGAPYECRQVKGKISSRTADIANKIWDGPKRNGKQEWFGSTHDMPFGGDSPFAGLANTECNEKGEECRPTPFGISEDWIRTFLAKDKDFDVKNMSEEQFWSFLAQSRREFSSIMGSDSPDLSEFRAAGGKLIHWHGLADQVIFPNGSSNYFDRVLSLDADVRDFYRYFEAPGVLHCAGGIGAHPSNALESLVNWVEKGAAPENLSARVPGFAPLAGHERILCPYPLVASFKGGDSSKKENYECAEGFSLHGTSGDVHEEL